MAGKFEDSQRGHAIRYAHGLTAEQLLAKLAADGVQHPGRFALMIGVGGRGSALEVAREIVRQLPRIEALHDAEGRRRGSAEPGPLLERIQSVLEGTDGLSAELPGLDEVGGWLLSVIDIESRDRVVLAVAEPGRARSPVGPLDVARMIRRLNGLQGARGPAQVLGNQLVDMLDQLEQLEAASRQLRDRLRPEAPSLTPAEVAERYGHSDV